MEQLTLGGLIKKLESFSCEDPIAEFYLPHSYRGRFNCLAFERKDLCSFTAVEALKMCQECIGAYFGKDKGGLAQMHSKSPVYIAERGETGYQLLDIEDDGSLILRLERI